MRNFWNLRSKRMFETKYINLNTTAFFYNIIITKQVSSYVTLYKILPFLFLHKYFLL